MTVASRFLEFQTKGNAQAVNVTDDLRSSLAETGLKNGICTLFVPGSTGGVTTVEFEPGLLRDLQEAWERLAPSGHTYKHDEAWGDGNGHSHIRASLLGASLTIPFVDGNFALGTWQQVIFVDFDNRSRLRRLVLQFLGE